MSEDLNRQVEMQRWLDAAFPEGARVGLLTFNEDRVKPDFQVPVGRLFCTQASLITDASGSRWIYEVMADFNIPGTEDTDLQRPFRFWVEQLVDLESVEHELWEGTVLNADGSESGMERVRILPGMGVVLDVDRQEIPLERMKEYVTQRWETRIFPNGLEAA